MKRTLSFLCCCLALVVSAYAGGKVSFNIQGIVSGDDIIVSVSSDTYLKAVSISTDGTYEFIEVPVGTHYLKVEAPGYNIPEAKSVVVDAAGNVIPNVTINLAVTKMSDNPDEWTHHWEEDGTVSGYVTTSHVNTPAEIEYLGKMIVPSGVSYASLLYTNYSIILSDDIEPWTEEYAYRLYETITTLPVDWKSKTRKLDLTSEHVADDITILDQADSVQEVTLSADAFYYANPFLVDLDGVRGRFFSKRLHHALTKLITDFGKDDFAVDVILTTRFGCSVNVPDYAELTRGITDEDDACFSRSIHPSLWPSSTCSRNCQKDTMLRHISTT